MGLGKRRIEVLTLWGRVAALACHGARCVPDAGGDCIQGRHPACHTCVRQQHTLREAPDPLSKFSGVSFPRSVPRQPILIVYLHIASNISPYYDQVSRIYCYGLKEHLHILGRAVANLFIFCLKLRIFVHLLHRLARACSKRVGSGSDQLAKKQDGVEGN